MEKGLACIWIRSNRGWHLLFPRFVNCYFVLPLNLTVQRLLLSFTNLYVYWPCRLFWVLCEKKGRDGSALKQKTCPFAISTFCQPLFIICVVSYSSKKWFLASHTLREIECQTGRLNDKLGDRTPFDLPVLCTVCTICFGYQFDFSGEKQVGWRILW